ncbi:MAG: PAS domain-containing sensor histidine kinase [Candidatus Ozemobacteraceae bacterium]
MRSLRKPHEGEKSLRDWTEICSGRRLYPANSLLRKDFTELSRELRVRQLESGSQSEEFSQSREELEKSLSKYYELYEFAPVGYFSLGKNGKILETNLTGANLLGTGKVRLLNRSFSNFVAPEFRDAWYLHSNKVIRSGIQETCELKLLKKNGDSFFVHLEITPIRNFQNLITQIQATVIDIHEKKQVADLLKESANRNESLLDSISHPPMLIDGCRPHDFSGIRKPENRSTPENGAHLGLDGTQDTFCLADEQNKQMLVTVVEDSNDAISVLDLNGNIKAWNYRAEEIYGFSVSEALKMSIYNLIPSRLQKQIQDLLGDIRSGKLVQPFETRRVTKEGRLVDVWLKGTRLVQDDKIVGVIITERDISEYNRWMASEERMPQRIILAQEKERSRVSQEIHSDFGQSLIALKMFIGMSTSTLVDENPQLKVLFEKVRGQLSDIIDKARDLSHELAPPSLKYIGLVQAIKKMIEFARHQKNLEIGYFHRNIDRVNFQKKDIIIYRIVQEALNNIFKHAEATRARIKVLFRNPTFFLEISDDGKGFDPKKKHHSAGLGLDLMKEQVALINGTLQIESRAGKGTSIKITVPIKEQKKQKMAGKL